MSSSLTLAQLSEYFHLPEKQVAEQMGMCLTSLKKVCRAHGITRWPFRKLKSLERTMKKTKENPAQSHKPHAQNKRVQSSSAVMKCPQPQVKIETDAAEQTDAEISPHPPAGPLDQVHWRLVEDSSCAGSHKSETSGGDETWPVCSVDKENSNLLVVTNWSTLWTVHKLKQHLLKALGGSEIQFSEDGSRAYLWYTTYLAAMQARTVCEEACAQLKVFFSQTEASHRASESAGNAVDDNEHFDNHEHAFGCSNTDLNSLVESSPARSLIESSMRKANLPLDGAGWGQAHEPLHPSCGSASNGGRPTEPGSSGSSRGGDWEASHEWCLISC
mmetsp:Transcript_22224/g.45353  ORF Transcript_22224/g.45353 Transcript_22224/m.45353 type:complete len:330 (+) Transcript_22224:80-1069(+)